MSTLVYVGANVGNALWELIDKFDRVYAFEAVPEIFQHLKTRFRSFDANKKGGWVTLVNAACADKKGKAKFFVTPNLVSSSLSKVSSTTHDEDHPQRQSTEIEVDTINLAEYLAEEGVEHIDLYLSDIQGSDLNVLKTIKPFIDEGRIDQLYLETHGDNLYIYDGLDNQFQGFKDLLGENYEFVHAVLGRLNSKIVSEEDIPEGEYEWDSFWVRKEEVKL